MKCKEYCLYKSNFLQEERLCDECKKYSDDSIAPHYAYLIRLYFNEYLKKNKHNTLYANGVMHGLLVSMAVIRDENVDNITEGVSE
jgi:hypothetical protein